MYVRGSHALGTLVIIVLFVDDMGKATLNMKMVNKIKNDFMIKYNMKDLGEPKKMLDMQFKYSLNRIFIGIPDYITNFMKYESW